MASQKLQNAFVAREGYFDRGYFDVALLVTSSRFTEAELMLSRELEKFQVR